MCQLLQVQVTGDGVGAVVLPSKFDSSNCGDIVRQLVRWLEEPGHHRLDLELGNVTYLSSVALVKLVALHRRAQEVGGEVRLGNVPPAVVKVLADLDLAGLFGLQGAADPAA